METLNVKRKDQSVPPRKSEFAKNAENLLQDRLATVAPLGELLEKRNEQQAALADTDAQIEKAVEKCLQAGWTTKELQELGVETPKQRSTRGRRTASAVLEVGAGDTNSGQPKGAHPPGE